MAYLSAASSYAGALTRRACMKLGLHNNENNMMDFDSRTRRTLAVIFITVGPATFVLLRASGWQGNVVLGATAVVGSVLLILLARRQRRRLADGRPIGTAAFERLVLPDIASNIRQRVEQLVNENKNWVLDGSDDPDRLIEINTWASLRSFGERIEVRLVEVGPRKTGLHVLSQPSVPATAVDFGKNRENVDRIVRGLRDLGI